MIRRPIPAMKSMEDSSCQSDVRRDAVKSIVLEEGASGFRSTRRIPANSPPHSRFGRWSLWPCESLFHSSRTEYV